MRYIIKNIISNIEEASDLYNLSYIGNVIGVTVAKYINENKEGFEKDSFLNGINNGLTKSNQTNQEQ